MSLRLNHYVSLRYSSVSSNSFNSIDLIPYSRHFPHGNPASRYFFHRFSEFLFSFQRQQQQSKKKRTSVWLASVPLPKRRISRIPNIQTNKCSRSLEFLRVAVISPFPLRYLALSRISHRILVKSRMQKIPFQTPHVVWDVETRGKGKSIKSPWIGKIISQQGRINNK